MTAYQRCVALCAARQIPLSVSLEGADESLRAGLTAFRGFVDGLLSDLSARPAFFGFDDGAYDRHLAGRRENAAKRDEPNKTLALRASTNGAPDGYLRLLYWLGGAGEADAGGLFVPKAAYDKIAAEFDRARNPKKATIGSEVPYGTRLAALAAHGFVLTEEADGARVQCPGMPGMLWAMSVFAKASKNVKTYGEHNFFFGDFRQIAAPRGQDFEDVIRPLSAPKQDVARAIDALLRGMGMRISITTFWKVNYLYKGKHAACLDTDSGDGKASFLTDHFRLRIDGSAGDRYLDEVRAEGAEFQKYFERHMNYCTCCSTSHVGGTRQAFGRTVRLCCCPIVSFRVCDPSADDLPNIRKAVELRLNAIRRKEA